MRSLRRVCRARAARRCWVWWRALCTCTRAHSWQRTDTLTFECVLNSAAMPRCASHSGSLQVHVATSLWLDHLAWECWKKKCEG